jgi:hypothetical protein
MIESVKARTIADPRALADRFRRMITAPPGAPIDNLGPLAALSGSFRCATLPWDRCRLQRKHPTTGRTIALILTRYRYAYRCCGAGAGAPGAFGINPTFHDRGSDTGL